MAASSLAMAMGSSLRLPLVAIKGNRHSRISK
jgi:hypothetical protein